MTWADLSMKTCSDLQGHSMKTFTGLPSTKRIEFWMSHVKISSKGQCHILHCKKPSRLTSLFNKSWEIHQQCNRPTGRLTKSDARRCLPAWKERMTAVQQGHGSTSTFHCISHHTSPDPATKKLQMYAFMRWFSKLGSCKIGRIEVFLCKTSLILWVSSFRCLCRCSDKDMKLSLKIKLLLDETAFLKAFHLPHFQATLCCFNRSTLYLKCPSQRTHHIGMIFWEILASAPAGSSLFRALWWCKRNQRMLCSRWRLTLSTLHASQQNHLSSAQWDQVPRTQTPACDTCAHCASQSFTVWHQLQCLQHLAAPWTQVEANHPVISLRKDSTWPFLNIPCIQNNCTLQALFGFLSYQTLPGWHDNFDGFRHPSDEALVANGTRGLGSTFIVSRHRLQVHGNWLPVEAFIILISIVE